MSEYDTLWWASILANCLSIAASAAVAYSYSGWKKKRQDPQDSSYHLKWYDYIIGFLLTFCTSFIVYSCVFGFFGYVPMGKIAPSLHERDFWRR